MKFILHSDEQKNTFINQYKLINSLKHKFERIIIQD
jgi:hypothetical protein